MKSPSGDDRNKREGTMETLIICPNQIAEDKRERERKKRLR
jgi:hypothetical protein